jgi:hypothetical protein
MIPEILLSDRLSDYQSADTLARYLKDSLFHNSYRFDVNITPAKILATNESSWIYGYMNGSLRSHLN